MSLISTMSEINSTEVVPRAIRHSLPVVLDMNNVRLARDMSSRGPQSGTIWTFSRIEMHPLSPSTFTVNGLSRGSRVSIHPRFLYQKL